MGIYFEELHSHIPYLLPVSLSIWPSSKASVEDKG